MNHLTTDTSETPWNKYPEKEIEVTITLTISKAVKVKVDDYEVDVDADEDGLYPVYDFSKCDLRKAVENQVTLPHKLASDIKELFKYDKVTDMSSTYLKGCLEDCDNWDVDELEITQ